MKTRCKRELLPCQTTSVHIFALNTTRRQSVDRSKDHRLFSTLWVNSSSVLYEYWAPVQNMKCFFNNRKMTSSWLSIGARYRRKSMAKKKELLVYVHVLLIFLRVRSFFKKECPWKGTHLFLTCYGESNEFIALFNFPYSLGICVHKKRRQGEEKDQNLKRSYMGNAFMSWLMRTRTYSFVLWRPTVVRNIFDFSYRYTKSQTPHYILVDQFKITLFH